MSPASATHVHTPPRTVTKFCSWPVLKPLVKPALDFLFRGVGMKRVQALLEFVRERGAVHPREVDAHFSHGSVTNYWGGSSTATTHLLEDMHYRSLLRVARREGGIRIYATGRAALSPKRTDTATSADIPSAQADARRRIDALVDVVVRKYAPLPNVSLSSLVEPQRSYRWTPGLAMDSREMPRNLVQPLPDRP